MLTIIRMRIGGQLYWRGPKTKEHASTRPGRVTTLYEWRTRCATCQQPFGFFVKGQEYPASVSRRCRLHGRPGKPLIDKGPVDPRARSLWITQTKGLRRFWRARPVTESDGLTFFTWRTRCDCGKLFDFWNPGRTRLLNHPFRRRQPNPIVDIFD